MSIKILHAADFHMDSSFDALPEDKAIQRRKEQRLLLRQIADICQIEGVQIVLLAGDLFDSSFSYYETEETLLSVFPKMDAHIFISPGNHDYFRINSLYSSDELPKNVHVFSSPRITYFPIPELNCRVWGAGWDNISCPSLLPGFSVPTDDMINLMVLHGDVGGTVYNPILESDIAASGLDYLALGHVHTHRGVYKAGTTSYAYSGCPEGRGFDETGKKGVIIGSVDKGSCALSFYPLKGREYRIIPVDLTEQEVILSAVLSALPENIENDICKIVLTGSYDGDINIASLETSIQHKCYHAVFKNETFLRRNLWDKAQEDTLVGSFLRKMQEQLSACADDESRRLIETSVRFGLSALENREEWHP